VGRLGRRERGGGGGVGGGGSHHFDDGSEFTNREIWGPCYSDKPLGRGQTIPTVRTRRWPPHHTSALRKENSKGTNAMVKRAGISDLEKVGKRRGLQRQRVQPIRGNGTRLGEKG